MAEQKGQFDSNETPEDVASLYSWANLHGAKYRDFSASRAQTRERARQRVEQAMEEERHRSNPEAETKPGNGDTRSREAAIAPGAQLPQGPSQWADRSLASPGAASEPQHSNEKAHDDLASALRGFAVPPSYRQPPNAPQQMQEESGPLPRASWSGFDSSEPASLAWLMPENSEAAGQSGLPPAPEDTLQGSRDRLATRWFALRGVFESGLPPAQAAPALAAVRPPVLAVFSLAGGVGKTSLVATLGRALSARGERVLLVDTAAYGLLPFFFGACDQRPGLLRTFSPPASSGDAPIQMITLDPESFGPDNGQEMLSAEISKHARAVGRVIVDLATASGSTTRRIMRLAPQVLVPLVPDMNSVVSVNSIDAFFERNGGSPGTSPLPHYLLNQFDAALPLHLDVREVLREQLGERLLPFVLRRAPAIGEALAEGMTVMDYAPNSAVAEDFSSLAGWVKSLSAPASTSFRGVRWSER